MQNFKHLNDQDLHKTILQKVEHERQTTLEVLHLLREVDRRRLYLDKACGSLHAYCVQILKYSDAGAQRRIQSMRLLRDIPQIEETILKGKITLSQLAQAQNFFVEQKKENKPFVVMEKLELLESLHGKSSRETERVLLSLKPEPQQIPKERIKPISEKLTTIEFTIDEALMNKIEQLKASLSHVKLNPTFKELFELLIERELKKQQSKIVINTTPTPESKPTNPIKNKMKESDGVRKTRIPSVPQADLRQTGLPRPDPKGLARDGQIAGSKRQEVLQHANTRSNEQDERYPQRYIPTHIRKQVFQRDHGQCQYTDKTSGKKCSSTKLIQFEHKMPFSLGGKHTPDNLTLFCAGHNQQNTEFL